VKKIVGVSVCLCCSAVWVRDFGMNYVCVKKTIDNIFYCTLMIGVGGADGVRRPQLLLPEGLRRVAACARGSWNVPQIPHSFPRACNHTPVAWLSLSSSYVRVHVCAHPRTPAYTHTHTCIHICIYVHTFTYICMYIYEFFM